MNIRQFLTEQNPSRPDFPTGRNERYRHSFGKGIDWIDAAVKKNQIPVENDAVIQDKWLNMSRNKKRNAESMGDIDKTAFWDGAYQRTFQYWQKALDNAYNEKNK